LRIKKQTNQCIQKKNIWMPALLCSLLLFFWRSVKTKKNSKARTKLRYCLRHLFFTYRGTLAGALLKKKKKKNCEDENKKKIKKQLQPQKGRGRWQRETRKSLINMIWHFLERKKII